METKSNNNKPENMCKNYDATMHNYSYNEENSLKWTCWHPLVWYYQQMANETWLSQW